MNRNILTKRDLKELVDIPQQLQEIHKQLVKLEVKEGGQQQQKLENEIIHPQWSEQKKQLVKKELLKLQKKQLQQLQQKQQLQEKQLQLERQLEDRQLQVEQQQFNDVSADDYTSKLIKYIPGEVIALYITLDAIVRSSDSLAQATHWAIFLFGAIATYLYLWRVAKVTKQLQLIMSVGAFCVWVFAMGGPFVLVSWYQPAYGGLLLPIYTFLLPVIDP